MFKRKRKVQPQSTLKRFWREFLFSKSFYFETIESPAKVRQSLKQLHQQKGGMLIRWQNHLRLTQVGTSTTTFALERRRRTKSGNEDSKAEATGEVTFDEQLDRTVIQGEARFSAAHYVPFFILALVMIFPLVLQVTPSDGNHISNYYPLILFLGMMIWVWIGVYRDRNQVIRDIENAVFNARFIESPKRPIDRRYDEFRSR